MLRLVLLLLYRVTFSWSQAVSGGGWDPNGKPAPTADSGGGWDPDG